MSAIFAAPYALEATDLSGSEAPTAKLSNLLVDHMATVWRTTGSAENIVVTTSGLPIDTIALLGTNLRAVDRIRVRLGPNADGTSPAVDVTLTGATNVTHFMATPVTAAYVRFDFTRATGLPYVEASRLIISKRLECDGISVLAEQLYEDKSRANQDANWTVLDPYSVFPNWKFAVDGIEEDDFFMNWDPFLYRVGNKLPFLFIPYTNTPYVSQLLTYGTLTTAPKITWITAIDRRVEMTLRGI